MNSVSIYALNILGNGFWKKLEPLINLLPANVQIRYGKLRNKIDYKLGMGGELLTRLLLSEQLKKNPEEIIIKRNSWGKPYVTDGKIFFNRSHAGSWIVVIIGHQNVGIDIERVTTFPEDVYKRYFAQDIFKNKLEVVSEFKNGKWDLWTLYEASFKADGRGWSSLVYIKDIIPLKENRFVFTFERLRKIYAGLLGYLEGYSLSYAMRDIMIPTNFTIITYSFLNRLLIEYR